MAQRSESTKWIEWVSEMAAIAQNGLTYATDPFDVERYTSLRQLAAEIAAAHTDASPELIQGLFEGETGHATPKVDVRGVVLRDEAVLMIKERADGLWALPGGWADPNESPAQAVVREIREESGFTTRATRLLAVYDRGCHDHPPYPFATYMIFFQCELVGGAPLVSHETEDVAFFRQDELPAVSSNRVTVDQLKRVFELYYHPDWPADFD